MKKDSSVSSSPLIEEGVQEIILENGLKVLLKEDHSSPIISQAIFYRVGSRNDPKGLSGMSHFLEHMQFNGTATKPKGYISREIEARGGNFNAATSTDYTMYYITLPSEHLDFIVELEADRMKNSIVNDVESKREKQVVLSELMGGENNPMTLLSREVMNNLYPTHPYGTPIIGWRKDLDVTTSENLKNHYNTYYTPNNAVYILVGDFDSKQALELVKKYFGPIKNDNLQAHKIEAETQPITKTEVEVKSPSETLLMMIAWRGVNFTDPDFVPLYLLSDILTTGELSRFEKKLVDDGKASYVNSSMRHGIDPMVFAVYAATDKSGDLNEVKKVILDEISNLKIKGVSEQELNRAKAKSETAFYFGLEEPSNLASQMGFFEIISGDWKRTFSWPEEVNKVTVSDIQRVIDKYLTPQNMVVGTLAYDENSKGPAGPITPNDGHIANYKPENSKVAVAPKKGIKAQTITLSNGVKLVLRKNPSLPIVAVSASMDAGKTFGDYGISSMTADLLDRGTKKYTRDQIYEILEQLGAEVEVSSEKDFVQISAKGRSKDAEAIFDVLSEELINPTFPEDEFSKVKKLNLSGLEQSKDSIGTLAKIKLFQTIYSPNHPYYEKSLEEQIALFKAIKVDDLKKFHSEFYQPNRLIISVSGDFDESKIKKLIEQKFGNWKASDLNVPSYKIPAQEIVNPSPTVEVKVPGKSQAMVLLGHSDSVTRSSPDFYPLLIANDILGGGSTLSSRLGTKVREEAGLVYSIGSSVSMTRGAGPFTVQMGVPPEKIDKAIELTKAEIKAFIEKGDITDEELSRAKNFRSGFFISHNLTSNESVASSLNQYALWDMELDTINLYPDKIKAVTKDDVLRVSKKYMQPDKLNVVIVRPK
jgi:zinc protease